MISLNNISITILIENKHTRTIITINQVICIDKNHSCKKALTRMRDNSLELAKQHERVLLNQIYLIRQIISTLDTITPIPLLIIFKQMVFAKYFPNNVKLIKSEVENVHTFTFAIGVYRH